MAAIWNDIPNGDIDTGSPITQSLMFTYRDRDEGLAAGVAGAPKIQLNAMDANSVGTANIVNDAVTIGKINLPTVELSNTVPGSSSHVLVKGTVAVRAVGPNMEIQYFFGGAWDADGIAIPQGGWVSVFADGTYMRIFNNDLSPADYDMRVIA